MKFSLNRFHISTNIEIYEGRFAEFQRGEHIAAAGALNADVFYSQSSIAMAFREFDQDGRMRPPAYYERIVERMKELVRFTVLLRPHVDTPTDRYSERKAKGDAIEPAVDFSSIAIASPTT